LTNIVHKDQEKQNTEGTTKKRVFFNGFNFLKTTEFRRSNIFTKGKKRASHFDQNTHKKILSSIGRTMREKEVENFIRFFCSKSDFSTTQGKLQF
jgi:hypothetical protein